MSLETAVLLLTGLGFRKRAGNVFTLDLAPNVLGWLGLNQATKYRAVGEVEINPVIGVRFQDVERLVAECRGEKFHAYQPPTISSPLGYLMPQKEYKAWVFTPENSEEMATDMAHAITTHGVAFMRTVADLAELRRLLRDGFGFDHQLAYRRPAAALVSGEAEQARALLDEELASIGARTDLAAAEFRRFEASLRSRLPPRSSQ
ncbi:hypothetical protein ACQKGO_03610 [Corallococcus interemptor]|uniref:hypothetical protein n=1 Tax=Corallococcus interemptor TaxID=2316720 RepID=UPI003D07072A